MDTRKNTTSTTESVIQTTRPVTRNNRLPCGSPEPSCGTNMSLLELQEVKSKNQTSQKESIVTFFGGERGENLQGENNWEFWGDVFSQKV